MTKQLSPTELRNPNSYNLDTLSSAEFVELSNNENEQLLAAIREESNNIALTIDAAATAIGNGNRLIYIGAGTSGRLGVLDASECPPTFSSDPSQVVGIIAGGDDALRNSLEGAEDDQQQAVKDLNELNLSEGDLVIGIAASGNTPYVVAALEYARTIGAGVASLSNNPYGRLATLGDINIVIDSGPEVLTGSTRLKAGTAQKIVLNMISTGAMVANGKAFQNLMVDVAASNEKLIDRCKRIVVDATDCSEETANAALNQCDNHPKTAILMILGNYSADEARARLNDTQQHLSEALKN